MRINIETKEELEQWMEKFHVPFGCTLVQAIADILQELTYTDEYRRDKEIELCFNANALTTTYSAFPRQLFPGIKDKTDASNLQVWKRGDYVFVRAGENPIQPNFLKALVDALERNGAAKYRWTDLPIAYQINPYQVICRLKQRKSIKVKLLKTPLYATFQLV